ncbi:MAG: 4-hydroxy-tetrahydrodipicolinate synthase, partial [Bacteroidales bacterium]|nr:4-hydroxy-tetrahydrodipicolinate synthase [Bacteroidales bacterium]
MEPTASLSGVGAALVTPFDRDGRIDFKALERIIAYITERDTDFIVVLGTTGEAPTLSEAEKQALCEAVVALNVRHLPLVLGVGGNDTAAVAAKCARLPEGFDYVLSVAPYYNKPSQNGLFAHYKALAEASPKPIIVYNIPSRTGVNVNVDTLIRLADEVPGIAGVKEASGSLRQIDDLLARRPERFAVFSGDDALTFPLLCLGGDGVISTSANFMPQVFKQMMEAVRQGRWEEARACHFKALPLIRLFFEEGNPAGIKAALAHIGLCENALRLPLVEASSD